LSFWRKLRRRILPDRDAGPGVEPSSGAAPVRREGAPPRDPSALEGQGGAPGAVRSQAQTPEEALLGLATQAEPPDLDRALQLFDRLCAAGATARAIELGRALLLRQSGRSPGEPGRPPAPGSSDALERLALRIAERLLDRGDREGAAHQVQPLLEPSSPSSRALMLAAEIAELRGEEARALSLYERLLGRDVAFPQARERAQALREPRSLPAASEGATLATEGAIARGRYRLERELGRGGAGTVFLAMDSELSRRVALKVYHRRGPAEARRLQVEGRTPAALEHPGIVRIFDLDLELGALAMEPVAGGSVRREIARGAVTGPRLRRWLETALEAIAFVHAHGFVHRDLKPSNFLLRDDDRVVLTDFGLAATLGERFEIAQGGEGTLRYMPPEQRLGASADPAADVHAFGVSAQEIVAAAGLELPASLEQLLRVCTSPEAADRPPLEALRVALGDLDV